MGGFDDRAVSEVLGAILLFGVIVLAIGSYQSFVVPQQNAEIEQQFNSQSINEFGGIQEAISNAVASQRPRSTSITLGASYPSRVISTNPPPISSSLRTTNQGTLELSSEADVTNLETICGLSPETQSIQFQGNFNQISGTGSMVYEHGVTYRQIDETVLVDTDQELIDGSDIRLTPLVGSGFDVSSSQREQLRFEPGRTGTVTVDVEDELELTVPTRISAEKWENEILADENVEDVIQGDGAVTIVLGSGEYTIECTPVGINSKPEDQGPVPTLPDPDSPSDTSGDLNPAGTILLTNEELDGDELTLTFRAVEEPVSLSQARFNFYITSVGGSQGGGGQPSGQNASAIEEIRLSGETDNRLTKRLEVGRDFESLSPSIQIENSSDGTDVVLKFNGSPGQRDLMAVTFFIEETNERAQYIIGFTP